MIWQLIARVVHRCFPAQNPKFRGGGSSKLDGLRYGAIGFVTFGARYDLLVQFKTDRLLLGNLLDAILP